ncbi:MAG TPA: hypothetical protein VGE24_07805, partial [Emticicia sp.]
SKIKSPMKRKIMPPMILTCLLSFELILFPQELRINGGIQTKQKVFSVKKAVIKHKIPQNVNINP